MSDVKLLLFFSVSIVVGAIWRVMPQGDIQPSEVEIASSAGAFGAVVSLWVGFLAAKLVGRVMS